MAWVDAYGVLRLDSALRRGEAGRVRCGAWRMAWDAQCGVDDGLGRGVGWGLAGGQWHLIKRFSADILTWHDPSRS